jgi:hypothetical protein
MDRARLKERDENVRFEQSMDPTFPVKETGGKMEMQAGLFLIWLALIVGLGAAAIFSKGR